MEDATGFSNGFKDGDHRSMEYEFDANGNMTVDANKGIGAITYNHLNLPITITFDNGGVISYLYDGSGAKLQKTVFDSNASTTTKTDYLDGFQYQDGELSFFTTPEGYVKHTQGEFNYVYNYTDHLGNNRLSYTWDKSSQALAIMEENNYYPFGLKHENYNSDKVDYDRDDSGGNLIVLAPVVRLGYQYKYNGKEFQDELGLNVYAYGWRDYNPAIGRFSKIDRFSEKYHSLSPYSYAANNPIFYRDIQGDSINVGNLMNYDKLKNTNYVSTLISDLNSQTGLTFSVNKNGQLVYATDSDGNAIISTTTDENGNVTENGSAEARKIMTHAVSTKNQAYVTANENKDTGVVGGVGSPVINFNPTQMNSFISGAHNVDSRTQGWGMTLMHESLHSIVAEGGAIGHGNERYNLGSIGSVETRMNTVRDELNAKGANYGRRESYNASILSPGGSSYIPFDKKALRALESDSVPSTMYIQY